MGVNLIDNPSIDKGIDTSNRNEHFPNGWVISYENVDNNLHA